LERDLSIVEFKSAPRRWQEVEEEAAEEEVAAAAAAVVGKGLVAPLAHHRRPSAELQPQLR
jgi:hypothetical protein